ncbi:hypothetical protein EJB05_29766, partial [Eragrostis curvula]
MQNDDDFNCSANDMCKESKRQTINADDVLKALDEMEFSEFVEPLGTSQQSTSLGTRMQAKGPTQPKNKRKREENEMKRQFHITKMMQLMMLRMAINLSANGIVICSDEKCYSVYAGSVCVI